MNKSNNIKQQYGAIFDCDGVLLDSEPIGLESLYRASQAAGFPFQMEELTQFCGVTDHESVRKMNQVSGGEVDEDEFIAMKLRMYFELLDERGVEVFPGIRELLEDLSENSIPIAVATSAPRAKLLAGLKLNKLDSYFNVITTGDEIKNGKPAPDIFLLAAERLGISPDKCAVIEDTTVGVQAGVAAGMTVFAITNTFDADEFADLKCTIVDSADKLSAARLINTSLNIAK